jgi:lysophospholipase L1-like esterase
VQALAGAAVLAGFLPVSASAEVARPPCNDPLDLVRLASPLPRVAHRLAAGEPIKIVAIGSSSTAGAGASSPGNSYPSRLEAELKVRFRGHPVTVINRGVNGEEVADMLKRFDDSVLPVKPDLVLWQLGTNSVIRDHKIGEHAALIRAGLKKLRAIGADVVLIDLQYAPRVIAKPDAERMVEFLAVTAKQENVDLFRRYAVMKRWYQIDRMSFDSFVAPDGLHLNDWSYACMAKGLGQAIAEAAQRPVQSATAVQSNRTP